MTDQWDQFPDAQTVPDAAVTDTSASVPTERMTPRFKAADEAMARSAHLIATLPYRSPAYQAAVEADKHIEDEYNAAKAEALARPTGPTATQQMGDSADIWAHFPDAPAPHDWKDELGIGVRGIGEGLGNLADIPAGALNAGVNAITGSHLGTTPFTSLADSAADAIGLPKPETDSEKLVNAGVRGATGGLTTGGVEAVPIVASALSGAGAGMGSELAHQSGAGPVGQLAAGLAGGLVAPGAMAGAGRVAGAFTPLAEREMTPTMQAFHDQNVPAMPADVGGHFTKLLSAGTSKLTLGGMQLENAAKQSVAGTQSLRDNIAGQIGKVADTTGAGLAATRGANSFLDSTKDTATKLYDAIPIPANRPTVLTSTKQALSNLTAGLESNPELSQVIADPRMARIADAIQGKVVQEPTGLLDGAGSPITRTVQKGGNLSWQDLKDFRSYIGEKAGAPALQSDTSQANLKALYGALSDDMQATARAEGPKAAAAFNRANTFWRARQQRIADVITPILGKDGANTPGEAFKAIQSWAGSKGDFVRTAQALRSMPEEEAGTIRATIFSRLGDATAGAQNAAGDAFSPSTFMTQWNALKQNNPRALNVLFPGEQYQKDINDLVTIADAQKAAAKLGQGSPTAHLLQAGHVAGRVAHAFVNPVGAALDVGGELFLGHLLSSPTMARWMASAVKKPNAAAQMAHVDRLSALALRQPAIANDVMALQSRLRDAFGQAPQPLAAQATSTDQSGQNQ